MLAASTLPPERMRASLLAHYSSAAAPSLGAQYHSSAAATGEQAGYVEPSRPRPAGLPRPESPSVPSAARGFAIGGGAGRVDTLNPPVQPQTRVSCYTARTLNAAAQSRVPLYRCGKST